MATSIRDLHSQTAISRGSARDIVRQKMVVYMNRTFKIIMHMEKWNNFTQMAQNYKEQWRMGYGKGNYFTKKQVDQNTEEFIKRERK